MNYFCVALNGKIFTEICECFLMFSLAFIEFFDEFIDCVLVIIEGEYVIWVEFAAAFGFPSVGHIGLQRI